MQTKRIAEPRGFFVRHSAASRSRMVRYFLAARNQNNRTSPAAAPAIFQPHRVVGPSRMGCARGEDDDPSDRPPVALVTLAA